MSPRSWLCLVALMSAPVVQAQTAPVPSQDPGYSNDGRGDDGDFDDDSDEELAPMAPQPPPPLPAEQPTRRPYAGAVWASGHWYWDGDQWRFNPGTWLAPMEGYQFVNGYWEQDRDAWYWVSGGWAPYGSSQVEIPVAVTAQELTTQQAPPPPREEVRPIAPATNLVWQPGYWYWAGSRWDWVGGTWAAAPRAGLVFVSPRWVLRGANWHFVGGGWAPRGSVHVTIPVFRHARIEVNWGHPNYFAHTWYRAPSVRYYYHHPWRASGHYYRNDRVWRTPHYTYYRHRATPVRNEWRGRPDHPQRWRAPSHDSRRHDASPGRGGPHRGGGRGHDRHDRHH
ncbi:hypothetical protein LY474_15780 [Myxococcus stipitatus]|uniref:hypothetical protein n=1 Tax=Myxococcus stipitatus TaxID=83455 RepID=UPI001F2526E3|nr:hypothetical protein [Myxococcus stipitatus]MCE9669271.1 hypothetical protein [Myxococcus stipitatus]